MPTDSLYICCDWGTSTLRVSLFSTERGILADWKNNCGVASLAVHEAGEPRRLAYASALREALASLCTRCLGLPADLFEGSLSGIPVLLSGMVSSSIGFRELAYAKTPFPLSGRTAVTYRETDMLLSFGEQTLGPLMLISGVSDEADVMRGEEVQAVGILSLPEYQEFQDRSCLLLPGTHSKHIQIRKGEIQGFTTYLTGELYAILAEHSVLRHSLDANYSSVLIDHDAAWFQRGVGRGAEENISATLFSVRALSLLSNLNTVDAAHYLSGLLIGAELAGLSRDNSRILLAASGSLLSLYTTALAIVSQKSQAVPAEVLQRATCLGQVAIYKSSTE